MGQQRGNDTQNHNVEVTSPYNFVPLNKDVYFPWWGEFVSHDIPFEDGLSGSLDIEIEAKTPIFIRGTQINDEKFYTNANGDSISTEFMHLKNEDKSKKYFIPGSSFRNMIRSVVEAISFGKMQPVDELKDFSFRDMNNPTLYTLRRDANNLRMGWLQKVRNEVVIIDAGELGSLRYQNDNTHNQIEINPNLRNQESVESKYNLLKAAKYTIHALANNITEKDVGKILVCTNNIQGKTREFLFPSPYDMEICKDEYLIGNMLFDKFEKANRNNISWHFWRTKFENGQPVPIFFRTSNSTNILDFGLTVLYKLSYSKGILATLNEQQKERESKKPDLAETLFGKIENEKLKGRVFIPHAFAENAIEDEIRTIIPGSPKPTFYPFYIKQEFEQGSTLIRYDRDNNGTIKKDSKGRNQHINYKTLQDREAEIAGRKRYPIQARFNPDAIVPENKPNQKAENENIKTSFIPLKSGTKFKTKISYHNLKPIELGALLSALTFHGQANKYFHNLGFAKPYGFGKIKVTVAGLENQEEIMNLFEEEMNKFIKEKKIDETFTQSEQYTELLAMAEGNSSMRSEKLKYPILENFAKIKGQRKGLPRFSKFKRI